MARLTPFIVFAAICAALISGCATSEDTTRDEPQRLERWLAGGEPDADGSPEAFPETRPQPPRDVTLESLKPTQAPVAQMADLPRPEYFSFELDHPAYVSVSASSAAGAAISLIDRSAGTFASDGRAGREDGRIDTLLDAGEYRVRVQTGLHGGTAQIHVNEFTEVQEDPAILMNSEPGSLHEVTLHDGEQRSFWVHVGTDPLILEAMGRSLHKARIWKDGLWVTSEQPRVTEYSAVTGQQMGYVQMASPLEAGDYLITFYGGEAREWEEPGGYPLYVRNGARYLGEIVDDMTRISPMGRDAFLVSGDVTVFEVESADFSPVTLGIARYGTGRDRYSPLRSVAIAPDGESTRNRGSVSRSSEMRWLFVTGDPGDEVRMRALPDRDEYEIERPGAASRYLISTVSTLDADHAIDATPLIIRAATRESREEVTLVDPLEVADTPLVRETNLFGQVFFVVNLNRSGEWGILHDRPEDSPVAIGITPLRDLSGDARINPTIENPAIFDLEAGPHMISMQPRTPGIFKFALYYRGAVPVANDRRARSLLEAPAPMPRGDITYVTKPGEIDAGTRHAVTLNVRGGPVSALFVERVPLSLERTVPLTLDAGGSISVPVSPQQPGTISTGYPALVIRRNARLSGAGDSAGSGEIVGPDEMMPAGPATLTVTNTGATPLTFVLRYEPEFVASFSAPRIVPIAESLPQLAPGPAVFSDFETGQTRAFLLRVDEPGFYEMQTTGRLATRIATRTRVNPSGFTASANGPGRNALVQAYFRPGSYLVEVTAQSPSAGRAGLVMAPLPMDDLGVLTEDASYRTSLDAGVGLRATVAIPSAGRYAFETVGLYGSFTTRLEDADSWPVEEPVIASGVYTYISWPQTVWNRRVVRYRRIEDPVSYGEDDPWPLDLNGSHRRSWNENPERAPQQFFAESPATIPVTLRTSALMEWWVTGPEGQTVAEGVGTDTFDLPAGRSVISIRTAEENNGVEYGIALSTSVLADGLEQRVSRLPASIPIHAEQAGVYEIWSTGTWDVRAVLSSAEGEIVLASGDDRPGDWNFHISRYLPAGEYLLSVSQSFPGTGPVTVGCSRRDEVRVGEQTLPFQSRLQLDTTIVGIPFTTGAGQVPLRISASESAPLLTLYRGDTLVAEGRNTLLIPLVGRTGYVLRVRNDSLNPVAVDLVIEQIDTVALSWDAGGALELPPGASVVSNRTSTAVTVPGNPDQLLMSNAPEHAAVRPGPVVANQKGTLFALNQGAGPVSLVPAGVAPGRPLVFDLTDDDARIRVDAAPDTVAILEAKTMAGYLGLHATAGAKDPRDWSAADMVASSTVLGLSGARGHQVWVWDGNPNASGRKVELVLRRYAVTESPTLPGGETTVIPPGAALVAPGDATGGLTILLSPDLVAFTVRGGVTEATVAARRENTSVSIPGAELLYVVNTGRQERSARVTRATAPATLTVNSGSGVDTILPDSGTVTATAGPGRNARTLAVWAVEPSEVVLLTASGRRIVARPPDADRPFWTLPAVAGELRVTADSGPVAAWIGPGDGTASLLARGGGRQQPLLRGENAMESAPELWRFELDAEAFVIITTDNRGVTVLRPGGDQEDLPPRIAIGSGESRRILALLGAGTHTVATSPIGGEPQPAPMKLQVLTPVPISEARKAPSILLDAGDRVVFEVNVIAQGDVGIGLRAETDDFTTFLLNDRLETVGSGRIFYRELAEGRYYFLVENGERPMNVTPVVLADQGSRTGVPQQVIENYRENTNE